MKVETIDQSPTSAESSYLESNTIQLWSWNASPLLACTTLSSDLLGVEFTVQTDHKCLQYLHRLKDKNSRLPRWALALQPYDSECSIDQERPMPMPMVSADKPGWKILSAGEGGRSVRELDPLPWQQGSLTEPTV